MKRLILNPLAAVLLILVFILICCFVYYYVNQEKFIYFWDYATYYTLYTELAEKFEHHPLKAIDSINVSIRKADYNNLGTVPLLPFYYLLGNGRLPFILSIAIVYGFSTIFFFPFLLRKMCHDEADILLPFLLISVGVVGLLPQFWIPILSGYYDVAGVVVIFGILYLYFKGEFREKGRKLLITIGLMLSLLVILRRWYAYWVIGFFAACAISEVIKVWQNSERIDDLKIIFRQIFVIGFSAALSFCILATQNVTKMLSTNYGDIYSAYHQSKSLFQSFADVYYHFGFLPICLVCFGVIATFVKKEWRTYGIFLLVLFFVTFLSFTKTQDLDFHHYYWVISIFVIFVALFLVASYRKLSGNLSQIAFFSVFFLFCSANFSLMFFPQVENLLSPISFAFAKHRDYPKRRVDLEGLHAILLKLDDLTKNTNDQVYVFASNSTINSSILQNGCLYFEPQLTDLKKRIFISADVDKRDGFPFRFYNAKYLVIGDPIAFHLAQEDQRVIGYLAEKILKQQDFGEAYEKLPFSVVLADNQRVEIFQKTRNLTAGEMQDISDQFVRFYPDNKEIFAIKPEQIKEFSENK